MEARSCSRGEAGGERAAALRQVQRQVTSNAHKENSPSKPMLEEATFQALRGRISAASGLYIPSDENARYLLERRLAPRLRQRGVTSYADYVAAIDQAEFDAVLDVIAVHETYFFREKRQLDIFTQRIIPALGREQRPLKIWSAGCSTGEEAYTIAMLFAEGGLLDDGRVQILGSDLSNRVIASGQRAVYGASSFRTTEASFKAKYFREETRGVWRAIEPLRTAVCFKQANLVGFNSSPVQPCFSGFDEFDVIFCRNVLMHFDDAAARQTLRAIYSMLRPGGYLLVGHAESLLPQGLGFTAVQINRELVHRK